MKALGRKGAQRSERFAKLGVWVASQAKRGPYLDALCLLKTSSRMTRGCAYGSEAADGRVSDPAAACYPVAVHAVAELDEAEMGLQRMRANC